MPPRKTPAPPAAERVVPVATGTAGPPPAPGARLPEPTGFYADRLKGAGRDKRKLRELDEEMERHGYTPDGQIRARIAARLRGED